MAAFHQFIISPPPKKPVSKKVEKVTEEVPRLTLAPFNCTPEIKFGEILVHSKATKKLIIYNPSPNISFNARFSNIDSEDRIFINGCDLKSCEIHLEGRQEVEVELTWSPILSGYLRKTIRIFDINKKSRSFDVVLRGMAIDAKNAKNGNTKKLKENNKANRLPDKAFNSVVPHNQKKSDAPGAIRRQTYTINGKENKIPDDTQVIKASIHSSSPIFPKELSSLNVLNENSAMANFSIQSFPSCDSADGPMKYFYFKSELDLSADISEELESISQRRSTALAPTEKEDINLSLLDSNNHLRNFLTNSFSSDHKDEPLTNPDVSTPVRSNHFSDSLNDESLLDSKVENKTFSVKTFPEVDVFLTPQKNFDLDDLLLSPPSKLKNSSPFISKSTDCLTNIKGPYFQSFKRNDLFFISPPRKSLNKRCKKTPEDPFPHRSGSSAISDRKKLLKTNFLSRKRISPGSKNRGPRRISAFGCDISTVEKVKNRNPQSLKQAVSSHCQINDPFLKQVLYHEDKWAEKQETDIIKWVNSVLVPSCELNEEDNDYTVNAADIWLNGNRSDESSTISISNKVPPLYSIPQKLNILRKRKNTIVTSEPVKSVFQNLSRIIDRKIISIRDDRDLHVDEGLKKKLLHLLSCYNPVWLRMGLEAVYGQEIAVQPRADVGGLGLFIRKKLLSSALVTKRNANSQHDTVKKSMLLAFLKLVYFLDQARVQKLIRHDRCLFTLTSSHKSSQDLLSAFCVDLVIGRGYVMKHLKAINYNLQFKQTCVDEYNYWITSLDDLRDGIRLARLFEILFMEPDLCSKLRIPAIDIENKKHNVEVAMKVARSRCTIEGNITAEDIVLGNRAGSRMKTLSFLWQIINNYLTPLYERAATKIQRWWRVRLLHSRLKNFVVREKERKALVIQSAWKGYLVRKQYRKAIVERKQRIMAALTIQRRFRAFLLMKGERMAYRKTVEASIVLQSWYRRVCARQKFLELRNAVITVQRRYRALKLMIECRDQFVATKNCAIFLQRLRRANVAAHQQRSQYVAMRQAAVTIQRTYRRLKIFHAERSRYVALRLSAIRIQRQFRANRSMNDARERYQRLKSATLTVQRRFRRKFAMLQCRATFLHWKNAAIKIQQRFRANRLMRAERLNFTTLRSSTLVLQRKFRATQLMKADRCRYLLLKRHVVALQRQLRANNEAKKERSRYLALRGAAIFIQRRFRANQVAKIQRRKFVALKSTVVTIQRRFRANLAMKIDRICYVRLRQTVNFVQRVFRANQIAKATRMEFLRRRSATILIQRKYRAQVAMRNERQRFMLLRHATLFVQRKFCAKQLMKLHRSHYIKLLRSVVFLQRKFRANQLAKRERQRYLSLLNTAILIQQTYRAVRLMRAQQRRFLALRTSAIVVQQKFRANRAAKLQRCNYLRLYQTVLFVQRTYRANKIRDSVRSEYLQVKKSAVVVQQWYRSVCLMREQRFHFIRLRYHVIKIQKIFRGSKLMREERKNYEMLRTAVTTIQRRFRARCLMREARNRYLKLKNLTVAIQMRYVVVSEIRAAGICAANRKSLSAAQITKIGPLQLQKFDAEQRDGFQQMLKLRAEFLRLKMAVLLVQAQFRMKIQRRQFLRMKNATIRIQLWWRTIRGRWLAIREIEESARRVERNAATKIQAIWRGYSVRKKIILPERPSILPNKKDKENPDSKGTLGERYVRAIEHLKTSDMYNVITIALWNLETVTTFSAKLCEGVALEGIVPIIFSLVSRGNRSEPSIELYRASFSILINLARYAPTKVILWDNMDKEEDVMLILHIMKMTHDKFLKKNDIEVFRNSSTLLWLLCQDSRVARRIAGVNTLHFQMQKMMETLKRKCPCAKQLKSKRLRTLPKTESNWYADRETRIFGDNCFALSCIYNSLFNR